MRIRFAALVFAVASLARASFAAPCDLKQAAPWVGRWVGAWELTTRDILRLPPAPLPDMVFYDDACVYTTSRVTAGVAANARGTKLRGVAGRWWAVPHDGSLKLPDGSTAPVRLMSFANSDKASGPFFVMAAPSFWTAHSKMQEPGLTGVYLHELSHTRQTPGIAAVLGPIDAAWKGPEPLDDDIVQTRFHSDAAYVAAWEAERDLLYRAADAPTDEDARRLAAEALAKMRERHARWFTGDNAVFATLDDIWLSMEGAGQFTAVAWLSDKRGGAMSRAETVKMMLGSRKWWSQDEGLALYLVVDRLLPRWPKLVFHTPSLGATELLERATAKIQR